VLGSDSKQKAAGFGASPLPAAQSLSNVALLQRIKVNQVGHPYTKIKFSLSNVKGCVLSN